VAAWMGRSTQLLLPGDRARVQVYVDDPLLTIAGKPKDRLLNFRIAILWWCVAGLELAWTKLAHGKEVEWVGAMLKATESGAQVRVPEKKLKDCLETVEQLLETQVLGVRQIRKFAGKLSFIAGLIYQLRPFLSPLWATLAEVQRKASDGPSQPARAGKQSLRATRNLIHTRRIAWALRWHRAFFRRERLLLQRNYSRAMSPNCIYFTTDASPWGLGGVLFNSEGLPLEYFSSALSAVDEKFLEARIGESEFMTVWEGLALLVAMRLWAPPGSTGVVAHVRSDSLGALRALAKHASRNPSLNRITMELALDCAGHSQDVVFEHIPGITNVWPDALSRLHSPQPHVIPQALKEVKCRETPPRDLAFWRSTLPPA
jgi:hypothetical protein